ncbi:sel1 repeat family protein [Paraburkholderia sediminicola]|uniref:SEL1-like repeat protein n=1 Tax=Paraburkholderia sediminicola TaxID=458836 RepID=UPI0038BB5B6A
MRKAILIVLLACLTWGCSNKDKSMTSLPDLNAVRANLAFTCKHEVDHFPPLDPASDKLFQYARYLEKKDGPKDFNEVARYYRIAAAHGHYRANQNLQLLVSEGSASSPNPEQESIVLAEQLIAEGVPSGYFDIGHYLLNGYGLKQNEDMARRYIRKAADLGNPDAQYYIADLLNPADMAPDIAIQMFRCAADQGHAQAAYDLGDISQIKHQYTEAIKAFQMAVTAGSSNAALMLESGFNGATEGNRLSYVGVQKDTERSRRYNLIGKFIDANDGRNPKVSDIDKIVPLPPARLPPWDGTFQWQKEQDAAVPPQKPSEELIDQLAKTKHLDPATGLPLAGMLGKISQEEQPTNVNARLPLGTVANTGESCPEDGVWCAKLKEGQIGDAQRPFLKGDKLPSLVVYEPRTLPFLDRLMGTRRQTLQVAWKLVAHIDQA